MSYKNVAVMAADEDLIGRIAGCVAVETEYRIGEISPYASPIVVAQQIAWRCAGQPGWADAYTYAVNTNVERPGNDEAVITDGMILSAVQLVLGIS